MKLTRYYVGASLFCLGVGLSAIHFSNSFGTAEESSKKAATTSESTISVGTVTMWWGSRSAVPSGWEICDGTRVKTANATLTGSKPDLVDRFPKGAHSSRMTVADLGEGTGGNHNLPAIRIDMINGLKIVEDGAHSHEGAHKHVEAKTSQRITGDSALNGIAVRSSVSASEDGIPAQQISSRKQMSDIEESESTESEGTHSHAVAGFVGSETGVSGDGQDKTGANQPAYSELFFIIRVK